MPWQRHKNCDCVQDDCSICSMNLAISQTKPPEKHEVSLVSGVSWDSNWRCTCGEKFESVIKGTEHERTMNAAKSIVSVPPVSPYLSISEGDEIILAGLGVKW